MSESKLTLFRNFCLAMGSIVATLWIWFQWKAEPFMKGFVLGILITTFVFGLLFILFLTSTPSSSDSNCEAQVYTSIYFDSENCTYFDYTTRRLIEEGKR